MKTSEQFLQPQQIVIPLELETENLKMPISFNIKEGTRFDIGGIQVDSNRGLIISGVIAEDNAKINHIFVDEELRGGSGKALLDKLEEQLEKQRISKIFCTFEKIGTVEFFLQNGYCIISVESITEKQRKSLEIDDTAFDERITNDEDLKFLKTQGEVRLKNILLLKEIGKK
ncbi:MAG: GNAT family N-acetyltransferase [Patescibacteria group bacterium]|jgi:ribosomal protein S18 acetylase RimI-like enzyme